jgi:hypothetical protein
MLLNTFNKNTSKLLDGLCKNGILHFPMSELMKKRYIRTLILLEDEGRSRGTGKTAFVLRLIGKPLPQSLY